TAAIATRCGYRLPARNRPSYPETACPPHRAADGPYAGIADAAPTWSRSMTTTMAREIAEQPDALARTIEALRPMRPAVRELAAGRRTILFVARGSSDNAAVYGRYLLEVHAGHPAGLAAPSVGTHYGARLDLSDAVVVSVSQSGETQEIVEAQDWAARCGARTIAVTNGADSSLANAADLALVTTAGRELAVPATKSYTTQLA